MRIAVLSDTHDHLPEAVAAGVSHGDEIWHLGDVCEHAILVRLNRLGPPVRFVRGNCDSHPEWPPSLAFTLEGIRIHLEHIPPRQPPPNCDLLLHGHTHVPRDETLHGTRFLNPGCITRPNRGAPASWAWLTLEQGRPVGWRLIRV